MKKHKFINLKIPIVAESYLYLLFFFYIIDTKSIDKHQQQSECPGGTDNYLVWMAYQSD